MSCWNPDHYLTFESQRTRPAAELAARLNVTTPARIVDLGCGPGNSTAVLHRRWPHAHITGVDHSDKMIDSAKARYPQLDWDTGDIALWNPQHQYDIVFSNAALHWVPEHDTLIPRLFSHVARGGAFAAQIPYRLTSLAHQLMLGIADQPHWRERTSHATAAFTNESPEYYYDLLQPIAAQVDISVVEYYHVVESQYAIIDWLRSTGLRPILESLAGKDERTLFEAMLLNAYQSAFNERVDGKILFALPRMFIVSYR